MRRVSTADEVVEALGGLPNVCELTGANPKQAWNWVGRNGSFPASTYVVMIRALQRRRIVAPAKLWNMRNIN